MKSSRFLKMVEDACMCQAKEKNQQAEKVQKIKYEFSSRADEQTEAYLVRLEEVGEGVYVVRYGLASALQTHPAAGQTMLSLEAIQFLGRLWGSKHIPEVLRKDYKAWLGKMETDLIDPRSIKN